MFERSHYYGVAVYGCYHLNNFGYMGWRFMVIFTITVLGDGENVKSLYWTIVTVVVTLNFFLENLRQQKIITDNSMLQ